MPIDIKRPLRKILPHLFKGRDENLNEADTVQRIIKVFEEVFGYDPMEEITRETQVRDKYVDLAIKLDGRTRLLIEAKAAAVVLRDRHIEQAERYAAEGNMPWVILTNSVVWSLYHLSFDEGIEYIKAFSIDLASDDLDHVCGLLGLFHRHSIKKGELDAFWERRVALSPESIGKALFTEGTMRLIRRQIRRREGVLIDQEDLALAIHGMFSTETREQIGPPRVRRKFKTKSRPSTSRPASNPQQLV
ncbi:MAG TPA: type I restriction enzyme HsdR N-terminal domain-containing protein [Candidatus Eisenbacteria bacterium]|jgi:predicted type IV restriction endonuclease